MIRIRRPVGIQSLPKVQSPAVAGSSAQSYIDKVLATQPSNLIAYWPLIEASGTVADNAKGDANKDGTYSSDVSTWGTVVGIGDGKTAPNFVAGGIVSIYSAALNTVFNPAELTLSFWIKVPSGTWTDGSTEIPIDIGADTTNNFIRIDKATVNNRLQFFYKAGGTLKTVTKNSVSTTDWIHICMTVSATADAFKVYFNGSQEGTTQATLGTWAGALLDAACAIGAQTTASALKFAGYIAHVAIWNTPLSEPDIGRLSTP